MCERERLRPWKLQETRREEVPIPRPQRLLHCRLPIVSKYSDKRNREPSVPLLVDLLEIVVDPLLALLDGHHRVNDGRQQPVIAERKLEVPQPNTSSVWLVANSWKLLCV